MDISKLNKAEVLAALFNGARTQGMGIMHYKADHVMDKSEAEDLLSRQTDFDYVEGRVMKVDMSKDELGTSMYNRDNGKNAAEDIISQLILSKL